MLPFRHRWIAVIGAGAYYAGIVLLHEEISKISVLIERQLTRPLYNDVITVVGLAVAGMGVATVLGRLRNDDERVAKAVAVGIAAGLVVLAYNTLLVMNLESVHFVQYAILSIPVYSLTRRYFDSAVWITLLGFIDEAYQYFWLYRNGEREYLDFNDIVLNLLGGGVGLVLIYVLGKSAPGKKSLGGQFRRALGSRAAWVAAGVAALGTLGSVVGLVGVYADSEAAAPVMLRRTPPPVEFWIHFEWGKIHHNLLPLEGLVLCALLLSLFPVLDRFGGVTEPAPDGDPEDS